MKLLIITQVIDTEHPILGFFHRWVEEFATHCEQVHVIALQVGTHNLPANVTVHSLGKEAGKGRLSYLLRFYRLIWSLRHEYDNVFVHMNQIYVLLGSPVWKLLDKKIGLWYMHGSVPLSLKIAEKLTDKVFTGSSESFNIKSKKVLVTGHGIDTVHFAPTNSVPDLDLITVGRITPAKNLEALLAVVGDLQKTRRVTLTIVGKAITEAEKEYEQNLMQLVQSAGLTDNVQFVGSISQRELPNVLQRAKIFVTAAQNGSLDKAMLEAMSCGLQIVSMAAGSRSLQLGKNQVISITEFTNQIFSLFESNAFRNYYNTDYVVQNHSIKNLTPKIIASFS